MSKISREDNKKRFKTGMYPTQQDFENVFDSYVHKDDTIDPSKIVSGDENIVDIINRKAEEKHSHEIGDVKNLGETLQQIQDDLDTAEDNIAGHETRIVTLEAAKTDYEAFKERVRAFLEDANASDTTIDRWHEIENFLQGITDTETLTGLLNDLKQEILREIPEPQTGNYLELVEDLDAYTDAPDGKIVKYVGQTNEKYTRGFDYEYKASEGYPTPNVIVSAALPGDLQAGNIYVYSGVDTLSVYILSLYNGGRAVVIGEPVVGDKLYANYYNGEIHAFDITNVREDTTFGKLYVTAGGNEFEFKKAQDKIEVGSWTNYSDSEEVIFIISGNDNGNFTSWVYCPRLGRATYVTFSGSMPAQGAMAWQPIPSFNVIN